MRTRSRTPRPEAVLEWFATRQRGYVARRQLLAAGVSSGLIGRRLRAGVLLPEHRGVYRVAHRAPTEFDREMAAVLACGPGVLVSHRSAARVSGFLTYPATGEVWITTTAERGAALPGVRIVRTRSLVPQDVAFAGWLPLTSPARTLLDLAGSEEDDTLEEAVAAAQVGRLVREGELWERLARSNGRRGARAMRALLMRHTPPANVRSKAERLMLRLIRAAGLPEPLVNVKVGRWRPDFYWPEHQVVAEFDSQGFHQDIRAFRRDREKSNDLQLQGILVLRFTWQEVRYEPAKLEARLRKALGLN